MTKVSGIKIRVISDRGSSWVEMEFGEEWFFLDDIISLIGNALKLNTNTLQDVVMG